LPPFLGGEMDMLWGGVCRGPGGGCFLGESGLR